MDDDPQAELHPDAQDIPVATAAEAGPDKGDLRSADAKKAKPK